MAPRATTKRNKNSSPSTSSGLIFETSHSKAVCTVVIASARATTVEEAEICVRASHRTTPIVTVAAHSAERAIAVIAVTWNGKLQGRTSGCSTICDACRRY